MVEKSPGYVFPSNFHVVNPLVLEVVGVMVTKLSERKNDTSLKVFESLYLIKIMFYFFIQMGRTLGLRPNGCL